MGSNTNNGGFLELMQRYIGFNLRIVTKNGWHVTGTLVNVDMRTNNVMIENGTVFTPHIHTERPLRPFDCILIRGDSILFFHVLDGPLNPPIAAPLNYE